MSATTFSIPVISPWMISQLSTKESWGLCPTNLDSFFSVDVCWVWSVCKGGKVASRIEDGGKDLVVHDSRLREKEPFMMQV